MRKELVPFFVAFFLFVMPCFAQQAKKPTIMVVPDKGWCVRNHVVDATGNPDYSKAVNDENMSGLISVMGDIMAERGYPLKHLRACLDELNNEQALDTQMLSKGDGEIVENDLDKLTRVAQADILVTLSYKVQPAGPRRVVEFNVTGLDAATSKQLSGDVGNSSASSAPIPSLLKESVLGFMDNFCSKINRHFDDIAANGREGKIIFKMATDCTRTFESEVYLNGQSGELSEVIDYWFNENAVNGAYNIEGQTRNRLAFDQVRFPLFGSSKFGGKPKALDAQGFVRPIERFLAQFNISAAFVPIGIGKVFVILGDK